MTDRPNSQPDPSSVEGGYLPDLEAFNRTWSDEPRIEGLEDIFTAVVDFERHGGEFPAKTHLFKERTRIIPYGDFEDEQTIRGFMVRTGDQEIARYFPPDSIGIAIKHRRPKFRRLSRVSAEEHVKEHLKLQDTHVELIIGVDRDGGPGVVSLNNPQDYLKGRFGDPDYPMIFLEFRYPRYLDDALKRSFENNIRTMMACFNTASEFPGEYNGGDPLAAYTPESVEEHVQQMLLAIAGNESESRRAKEWFKAPEHWIYCSELAHVATSAGLLVPLNRTACVPLCGESVWENFCRIVEAHNRGEETPVVRDNKNKLVSLVRLAEAPEDLQPVAQYAPEDCREAEARKLSFKPMTMVDIIDHAFQAYFPREALGESIAPVQAAILRKMKRGIFESIGMDGLSETDARRVSVERLLASIIEVVETEHADYAAFRKALEPYLQEARTIAGPRPGSKSGEGFFVPPSLFHLIAEGHHDEGLLGLEYVGHGVHFSLLKRAD
jgi:hypothetical protein